MMRLLYRFYRASSRAVHWGRQRITPAGLLLLGVICVVPSMGTSLETAVGPRVFLLGAALMMLAMVTAPGFRGTFSVDRELPRCASVGEPVHYTVRVRNRGRRVMRGLGVLEELADSRLDFEAFSARLKPTRRTRSLQFTTHRPLGRLARLSPGLLPSLAPNESGAARIELMPLRRGILRFESIAVFRTDPFGLFRALVRVPAVQTLTVLPRRYPVPFFEMPGSPKYQPGGVALASRVGESEEFLGLREYRAGDPMRRIHWRSWARAGEPVTKEYQDEFFTRHALVLDTFTDIDNEAVFEEAVSVAASFASQTRAEESLLDLMFAGEQAYRVTAGRGLAPTGYLLEVLAGAKLAEGRDFSKLRSLVLEHAGELSGAICVFVEWDDARRELVKQLAARRIPMEVFVIIPPAQKERPVPGPIGEGVGFHVLVAGKILEGLGVVRPAGEAAA